MLKVFGSPLCPDCVNFKMNCDRYGIAYEYADITGDLGQLKAFLKLRDSEEVFLAAKQAGGIGIPAIVDEEGRVTLDWQKVISDHGFEPFEEMKKACNLNDRSGC